MQEPAKSGSSGLVAFLSAVGWPRYPSPVFHGSILRPESRYTLPGPRCLSPLVTPDGRYIIVRGRLWRAANPNLPLEVRAELVSALMDARRQVKTATRKQDADLLAAARAAVDAAKVSLGERGPVWWTDGSRDFNRHLVKNTPYADWYRTLEVPRPGSSS